MLKRVQHDALWVAAVQHDGGGSRPARLTLDQSPLDAEVAPARVLCLDQVDLPLPVPVLQLLFARDGVGHPVEGLGVDKANCAGVRRKSRRRAGAVLVKPRSKVGRHADVKRAALHAGENIDTGLFHINVDIIHRRHAELVSASMPRSWGGSGWCEPVSNCEAWTLKQVQGDGRSGDSDA